MADAQYGIPLAQLVTAGNRNDSPMLAPVMEKAEAIYNWWGPRVAIGDRGYDSNANHHWLDDRGITPVIYIRRPSHTKFYDGIYGTDGTPTCLGQVSMKYVRSDPEKGRLYRCREDGCHLKSRRGVLYCNLETWEDPESNIRLFGKVRRGSHEWKSLYAKRQAIERVSKSMKESRRLGRHCVRGLRQVTLHSLMSTIAFQATVLARLLEGESEWLRWMVRPIP